jgi:hypothetical protein
LFVIAGGAVRCLCAITQGKMWSPFTVYCDWNHLPRSQTNISRKLKIWHIHTYLRIWLIHWCGCGCRWFGCGWARIYENQNKHFFFLSNFNIFSFPWLKKKLKVRANSGEHARDIVRDLKSQTLDNMLIQANIRSTCTHTQTIFLYKIYIQHTYIHA